MYWYQPNMTTVLTRIVSSRRDDSDEYLQHRVDLKEEINKELYGSMGNRSDRGIIVGYFSPAVLVFLAPFTAFDYCGIVLDEMPVDGQTPSKISPSKRRRMPMCVGCGSQIHDQFILRVAPDLEWHASCLKCADCNQYLDETCTCFVREGKTYCKRDYSRLFGQKCSKCEQSFAKNDFVMRAKDNAYHIECFRCVACSRQLIPGDEFALREDGLFCKADHDVVERASSVKDDSDSESRSSPPSNNKNNNNCLINNNNNINSNNNNNNIEKTTNKMITNSNIKKEKGIQDGRSDVTSGKKGSLGKSEHKPTRIRTVLNEKQLHTLRTCYNANPRPDALMKEQLTEMTNLSPRVIRVWFQNKRCKDKKRSILMKQMQQQQQEKSFRLNTMWVTRGGGDQELSETEIEYDSTGTHIFLKNGGRLTGPMQGVPMVASSPVRHESPMNVNPVEVQAYQPPWKALSDFAMQSDLDHQPPFQQLMNSFDHMESDDNTGSTPASMMDTSYYGWGQHDEYGHQPPSVDSDYGDTPSDMSSPMSQ